MGRRAEVKDAVAKGHYWSSCVHDILGAEHVVGQASGPGWVRGGQRPSQARKQNACSILPGAQLLMVKPQSRVVETQA